MTLFACLSIMSLHRAVSMLTRLIQRTESMAEGSFEYEYRKAEYEYEYEELPNAMMDMNVMRLRPRRPYSRRTWCRWSSRNSWSARHSRTARESLSSRHSRSARESWSAWPHRHCSLEDCRVVLQNTDELAGNRERDGGD